jgi:two-component system, NtrC family, nitrogen regulation sensor histidine kinase NtrY
MVRGMDFAAESSGAPDASSEAIDAPPWSGWTRYARGAGFGLAAVVTAIAIFLTAATPGDRPGSLLSSQIILGVLAVAFLLILALAVSIGRQVAHLFRRDDPDAGARLHRRFVTLFATAAVAPAIVVALFFGLVVSRSMESWFSSRVRVAVEGGATVSRAYVNEQLNFIADTVGKLASAMDKPEARNLFARNRVSFGLALRPALERGFSAVYVIDGAGRVLARAEGPAAPAYLAPPPKTFQNVREDPRGTPQGKDFDQEDLIRVVSRLPGWNDAYLYVARPIDPGVLTQLRRSEQAVASYRTAEASRGVVQAVFVLAFLNTTLLVLVGAVWVGMGAATQIATPVARLVQAAERISAGDLTARVGVAQKPEEIAVLSRAFNRMTGDLQEQQRELKAASIEADQRRNFIEAVLAGVSAGVLGLDGEGRISALNRRALVLLDLDEQSPVIGRTLADAAPELVAAADQARHSAIDVEQEVDLARRGEQKRLRVRASNRKGDGVVVTFDDITRLVAAQRNAAWRDVARRIAHEIKNPLTPIQLSAERIRRKYRKDISSDLETFDRCTETIIRQVGDIGRMVDEFSSFARMPTPKFALEDAAELLRQAVFAQRVAYPDIAVELAEPCAPTEIYCDAQLLGQALTNVLKNAGEAVAARKATTPGLSGQIKAALLVDDHQVVFQIEDNGVGLPEKNRDRLTEPYVTTREKGTGLGLAIVKRIVEEHGGELTLADAAVLPGARASLSAPRPTLLVPAPDHDASAESVPGQDRLVAQ